MKRALFTLIPVLAIAIVAIAPHLQPAAANQQGPSVGDQLTGWAILCQMHGGKPSVDTSGRTVQGLKSGSINCAGGLLGGLTCLIDENPKNTLCDGGEKSAQAPGPWAESGIDPATLPIIATVPEPDEVVDPATLESPLIVIEAQVAWPATAGVADGIAVADVYVCALGGGEVSTTTRLPDLENALTIRCDGGVFAGEICDFAAGLVSCFNEEEASAVEQPSEEGEMVGTETTVPEPTMAPTMEPTASVQPTTTPTDEPVIEPTLAPTDAGPWTVPEGTLPPLEPLPTEVPPLT